MKVEVSELKDDALDWAVAKCAGRTLRHKPLGPQGGPILEGANITIIRVEDERIPQWFAKSGPTFMVDGDGGKYGQTPLVAAMRCFVASKLGDENGEPA